jgi:Spy/CpxP family protein refolding chaperone
MERAMGPGGPGGRWGEHGRWWNEPRAIEKLKLTDAQRKSLDDIYQQHRLTLIDLHATLEKAEVAMEPLMQADQPDEGKILSQIDRVAQARAELEKANARMLLGLRKELTPEQWKLIQSERGAHRDGGPGSGPGSGSGHDSVHKWHGAPGAGGPGSGGPSVQGGPEGQGHEDPGQEE